VKLSDAELTELVKRAWRAYLDGPLVPDAPVVGDYVVEITNRRSDPDAIGRLFYHGQAPFHEPPQLDDDGDIAEREVWDVRTLSGRVGNGVDGTYRWENALFVKLDVGIESELRASGVIA
jgi:hypothetical protein